MVSRRDFLKTTGSLVVYFNLFPAQALAAAANANLPGNLAANPDLDTWLHIGIDGKVNISSGKVELGQGIQTALAQIAAEELDVSIQRVMMVPIDTGHSPDESYTFGSLSIMHSGSALRVAAAQARRMLVEMAAQHFSVRPGQIAVHDGNFIINNVAVALDYWRLLGGESFSATVTGKVKPKPVSEYRIVGAPIERIDIPAKAFAGAIFIQDIRLQGMLHARLVRPPAPGATLQEVDMGTSKNLPGVVKIVRDGSFLAVIAKREEQAITAAGHLKTTCRWSQGDDLPNADSLGDWLHSVPDEATIVAEQGAVRMGPHTKKISAGYLRPYQAHASISPSMAIARKDSHGLTVWSHAQGMYPLRGAIARLVGLQQEQVRCIHAQASGCFGHNGADDAAADAALIAMRIPGHAIRLHYSRDDEFRWEPYGSAMAMTAEATLDARGDVEDWQYSVWSGPHSTRPNGGRGAGNLLSAGLISKPLPQPPPANLGQPAGGGDRNAVPAYAFKNMRIIKHFIPVMPLRVSALRALGGYANIFAIESFMDELAQHANRDPLEYRITQLKDRRAIEVLKKLGEISNWSGTVSKGPGYGRGIGFAQYKNIAAYCAVLMTVHVDRKTGTITLKQAFSVVDAGLVINPDGLRNQIEGGIIQGASWTLKERLQFSNKSVTSLDWSSYPILKFSEVPRIEIELINRPGMPSLGAGEASQGPVAAAIANAIADATGIRLREIPFTPDRILTMLTQDKRYQQPSIETV